MQRLKSLITRRGIITFLSWDEAIFSAIGTNSRHLTTYVPPLGMLPAGVDVVGSVFFLAFDLDLDFFAPSVDRFYGAALAI